MKRLLALVGLAYIRSWLFLLWSVFCVCVGAAWMFIAIVAALPRGVHL